MTAHRPIGPLALATVFATGILIIWAFVALTTIGTISEWFAREPYEAEELFIRNDGTPVIISSPGDENGQIFRTLDGKRQPPFDTSIVHQSGSLLRGPTRNKEKIGQFSWSSRFVRLLISYNSLNQQPPSKKRRGGTWYFVQDGMMCGHGYFANCGFEPGYIGKDGFQDSKPPIERQFAINRQRLSSGPLLAPGDMLKGRNGPLEFRSLVSNAPGSMPDPSAFDLLTEDGLVQVDLEERSVKLLLKEKALSAEIAIKGVNDWYTQRDQALQPNFVVLFRTNDRVRILGFNGEQQGEYFLPKELRDCDFTWYWLSDGNVLAQVRDHDHTFSTHDNSELFWFTRAGQIVRHEKVALKGSVTSPALDENAFMAFIVPSPGAMAGFYAWLPSEASGSPKSPDYWASLCDDLNRIWPCIAYSGALSLVFAILCFRRQRKYGLPWTGVWVGFVLLFGLPAYFGYLAHRAWPARLPCPNCGKRAARNRVACLECGTVFPSPAVKGIELFA